MKNLCKIFSLLIMAAFYASAAWSDEAMVIEVIDGDTILVQEYGRNREVDIKRIDAPELSQPFGVAAKEALEKILLNKVVYIDDGNVFAPDKNRPVSWDLIENGLAWCNNRIDRKDPIKSLSLQQDSMCNAELQARQKKLGLWAQASEPPWSWMGKSENISFSSKPITQEDRDYWRAKYEMGIIEKEKAAAAALAKAEFEKSPEGVALRKVANQKRAIENGETRARRAHRDAGENEDQQQQYQQQQPKQLFMTSGGIMTQQPGSSFPTTSTGETYFKPGNSPFSYGTGTNAGKTCFEYGSFVDCK